jgi:sterol desaturase/sphingolipid hydroxylase (fatty acid hydroxylase superfamily)
MSEWVTVFRRFPEGRVPITRFVGIYVHDWSRFRDGHPRMFDIDALELVTSAKPALIAAVYLPLIALMVGLSVASSMAPGAIVGLAAVGVLAWTLVEYLMHRFAFHFVPQSRLGVALAYLSHGVHHAFPRDLDRLVLPLIVTVPISAALLLVLTATVGALAFPFLGGFGLGYLAYDLIHHHIHRDDVRGVFRWLRKYHAQHHFSAPDRQFGVSSPLWDYVFRTGRS